MFIITFPQAKDFIACILHLGITACKVRIPFGASLSNATQLVKFMLSLHIEFNVTNFGSRLTVNYPLF